jgi:hypothetical protein
MSDHQGQLGERVSEAGREGCLGPEVVEASAKVLDEGMPGDDDPGGAISLQAPHGPESSLQPSVVGLDGIVGVGLRFMEGRREHLIEDPGVEAVPVGGDLHGRDPGAATRLGEEPPRRIGVPAGGEVHVDDLAELVDRPKQVAPGPSDPQVGLIDVPPITDDVLSGSSGLGELWSKPLDPPVHVT